MNTREPGNVPLSPKTVWVPRRTSTPRRRAEALDLHFVFKTGIRNNVVPACDTAVYGHSQARKERKMLGKVPKPGAWGYRGTG